MDAVADPPLPHNHPPHPSTTPSALSQLPPSSPDLGALSSSSSPQPSSATPPPPAGLPFGYIAMDPADANAANNGGDSPMPDAHDEQSQQQSHQPAQLPAFPHSNLSHRDDDFFSSPSANNGSQHGSTDTVMDDAPAMQPPPPHFINGIGSTEHPSLPPLPTATTTQPVPPPAVPGLPPPDQRHSLHEKISWIPIVEDHSSPGEDELARLRSKGEVSATDSTHWQHKNAKDLNDPDFVHKASGTIAFDIKHFNGTQDSPNTALIMQSQPLQIGGLSWRLRIYPKGNGHSYVSAYLVCESLANASVRTEASSQSTATLDTPLPLLDGSTLPKQTDVPVQMTMIMYNPQEPRVHHHKSASHRFSADRPDRGFHRFGPAPWMDLGRRLPDARMAILRDDQLSFICHVRILDDPTGFLFDAPAEYPDDTSRSFLRTGFWPLRNVHDRRGEASNLAAATVTFALLPQVRRAVYLAGTVDPGTKPLVAALQRLLCDLRRPISMLRPGRQIANQASLEEISEALNWRGRDENWGCDAPCCQLRNKKISRPLVKPWHPHGRPLQDFDPFQTMEFLLAGLLSELGNVSDAVAELNESFNTGGFRIKMSAGCTNIKKGLASHFADKDDGQAFPHILQIELPRQAFDEQSRTWKKCHDRVQLPDNLRLRADGRSWYSLYGLILHQGDYNSRSYTAVVRPNGAKWYKFTDANRYSADRSPHVSRLSKKQALVDTESHAHVAIYMRNDIAAKTLFCYSSLFQGYPETNWVVPDQCLSRPGEELEACNDADDMSSSVSSEGEDDDEPVAAVESSGPKEGPSVQEQSAPECKCVKPSAEQLQEQPMSADIVEVDYFGSGYYRGTMHEGYRHGAGKRIYPDGNTYEGEFQRDVREGRGTQTFKNGDVYVGGWKDDKMEGQGEYTTQVTGATYCGGFKRGGQHGKFTLTGERAEALKSCLICYDQDRDAVLYPCGHVCACLSCARKLDKCPYCHRSIGDAIRLYTI